MPHDMIDEYFEIYKNSLIEYGEKTCVFYACGSFYEVYKIENDQETIGNADIISEIIRCDFSNKNKSKRSECGSTRAFPDFCGFGIPYLPKYLTPLLENNYTVVIVDQLESSNEKRGKLVKRGVVAVHSPCLKSPDFETFNDTETTLLGITLEIVLSKPNIKRDNVLIYSVCSINNTTNTIDITENISEFRSTEFRSCLDDMGKILSRYNSREIRIFFIKDSTLDTSYYEKFTNTLTKYFDDQSSIDNYTYKIQSVDNYKYKEYSKISYQNEYLKRIYKHIDFGLVEPLEYLDLQDKHLSVLNFMFLLDFIAKHDLKYINNLKLPNIINRGNNLSLELNTIHQLNILPNRTITNNKITSVFDVVNYTNTAIGKRHLKGLLTKPLLKVDDIQFRYDLSNCIEKLGGDDFTILDKSLLQTIDFDRLHRKMGLEALHPYEFDKLNTSYINISKLFDFIKEKDVLSKLLLTQQDLKDFLEYIQDYTTTFNLTDMRRIGLNTPREEFVSFFNDNVISEVDKIKSDIIGLEGDLETIRETYDNIIVNERGSKSSTQTVKLGFTDNDGYFFTCTKIRYQKLAKECKDHNFETRQTSNMCKFTTNDSNKLSNKLITTRDLLVKRVKLHYIKRLQHYYQMYNGLFEKLSKFIEILDVSLSNVKCARKNNYCKPIISNGESSSFVANALRHPIIELINNDTEYIPNNVSLTDTCGGMLVYGLNSSGKSSLLRSVGICIVLAQSGLYVPCKSFSYTPFDTVISQVDLSDNLFANKSSFTSEMCGLQRILSCSGQNTLVLSDELCRGTEVNSSCAIVATTLLHLMKTNTKFFFTTHLHNLVNVRQLNNTYINTCHISVDTKPDGTIVFERTLQGGSGSDLYGLEVCKSILQNSEFIDIAFDIRNDIMSNTTNVIDKGKSRYNKKKIVDHCQVCNHKPKRGEIPLDTHHINEQKNCDNRGFINDKHFHKNKEFNLVSLCKVCHQKIDTGELVITGYKSSTSGKFLDYNLI